MVGPDLSIRRFTPAAQKILNLLPSDLGRSIDDIKPKVVVPDLGALILEVTDTLVIKEDEVRDQEGRWYVMCIRPYRTLENKIDGAVLTFVDITERKRAEELFRLAVEAAPNGMVMVDPSGRIGLANAQTGMGFGCRKGGLLGPPVGLRGP